VPASDSARGGLYDGRTWSRSIFASFSASWMQLDTPRPSARGSCSIVCSRPISSWLRLG